MTTGERILILEDDPRMLAVMSEVLEDHGYRVLTATRGEDAVDIVLEEPVDLVVADIRMEGMNGLDAVELSRQHRPELGTLIVSGYATPENAARASSLQAGRILKKPFKLAEFLERVREELKARQAHRARRERERSFRSSLLWALESMARAYDQPARQVPSRVYQDLAEALCRELGLADEVAREVGLACALASSEIGESVPDQFLQDGTSLTTLKYCLKHRLDPLESEPRIEVRVVQLVLAAVDEDRRPEDPFPTAAELAGMGVDPGLLEAYQRVVGQGLGAPANTQISRSRELLGLAEALFRAGQYEAARKAYQTLLTIARGREMLLALLGRGQLALVESDRAELDRVTLKVAELARGLGPVTHATTLLEAGLLRFRAQLESQTQLTESANELSRLGFDGSVALAMVALISKGRQPAASQLTRYLRALQAPRYFSEVSSQADWLIPRLLKLLPTFETPEARLEVLRLLCLFPHQAVGGLGALDPAERRFLTRCYLEQGAGLVPPGLLEEMLRDPDPELAAQAHQLKGAGPAVSSPPLIRLKSFGVLQIFVGSEPLPDKFWQTKKVKYFLVFLASPWGKLFSEDLIFEHFWPDKNREKAKQNLYWTTSAVRRCFAKAGAQFEQELVERREEALCLNPQIPHWHDLQEFHEAVREADKARESGDLQVAKIGYSRMNELYSGPFLEGYYLDWAVRLRDAAEQQYLNGLLALGGCCLQTDDPLGAIESAGRALEIDSTNEHGHELAMRGFLASGNLGGARQQYEQAKKLLWDELAVEPGPRLNQLYGSTLAES